MVKFTPTSSPREFTDPRSCSTTSDEGDIFKMPRISGPLPVEESVSVGDRAEETVGRGVTVSCSGSVRVNPRTEGDKECVRSGVFDLLGVFVML